MTRRGEGRLVRSASRLLIADDSGTYRAVAARVLRDAGYLVEEAADGATAFSRVVDGEEPIHLLIAELDLPRMRGVDVVRRIRESPRVATLPALVVSEALSEHVRRVLDDLGHVWVLSKNHALRELLYRADSILFPEVAEQRTSPRRLETLPVNYWLEERLYLQSCFDLSETGMFVSVTDDEPPPIGARVALRFWLPSSDRLVIGEGEVVWRNTASGDLTVSHPPGMGLRFTQIEASDRSLLREFVARSR